MTVRLMYDTTDIPANSIPVGAELVAGYIDGHYRSFAAVSARCPNAVHVPIAVFPSTNGGQVLDCETGDAVPSQCPGWIKMRRAAGVYRPTIYTMASQVGAVKQACAAAGLVFGVDWDLWSAHYDGRPSPDGYGEVAKQYTDHGPNGENCDVSAVFDDAWPHVGSIPAPTQPTEDPDMAEPGEAVDAVMNADGTGWVLDRWGGIHSVGGTPKATGGPYWEGQDVARRLIVTDPSKPSGYVLDMKGGLHPFGGAAPVKIDPAAPNPYWP